MLWLSKVYGIPAGMYASQVWGTVYMSEGSEFFFFFFWWGLLHGPQQGPDRMKEKNL